MPNWFGWLQKQNTKKSHTAIPANVGAFRSTSVPEDASRLGGVMDSVIPLPNSTPFFMLPVYRFLWITKLVQKAKQHA